MGLREDILALVVQCSGVAPETVDPADILGSTGLRGDRADAFFDAYTQHFKVDMRDFLDYFHYAGNEPRGSRWHLPLDAAGRAIPFWPITLDQLTHAADIQRWDVGYPKHSLRTLTEKGAPAFAWVALAYAVLIAFMVIWDW